MSNNAPAKSFWTTLPGIFTGIAALITATGGLIIALQPKESSISNSTSVPTKTEQLIVYANNEEGESYMNENNQSMTISFTATGKWLAIPPDVDSPNIPKTAKNYIEPKGDPNFKSNDDMPCPRYPLGALIVRTDKGECLISGEQGAFKIKPGETVYFLMNDVYKLYEDNEGHITVDLSIE